MLRTFAVAAVAAFALTAATASAKAPDYIAAAVADSHRPAKDTELDAARKPAQMLAFAHIHPGSVVVDFMPGGGYFTRLFSKAVGPTGHVYAFQPSELDSFFKDGKRAPVYDIAADPEYANVTVIHTPVNGYVMPMDADVVWTAQNYHDLHDPFMGPADLAKVNKAIHASLKPGGLYIVLDHRSKAGKGIADTNTLHRIDPAVVKTEVEAAGFKFAGESKVLANPKDDLTLLVFDKAIRHHTDQFIFKFKKTGK